MTDALPVPTPAPGLFFRFTDEEAWLAAARAAGFMTTVTDEKGNETEKLRAYTHDHAIDVVGIIIEGGEWDEDGNETVSPTTLNGFHVNYIGKLPDSWEKFTVTPDSPYRVFA